MASAKWVSPKCTQSKDGMKMVAVKVYKWKTECLILYGSEVLFFFFQMRGLDGILATNIFAVLKEKHFPV